MYMYYHFYYYYEFIQIYFGRKTHNSQTKFIGAVSTQ